MMHDFGVMGQGYGFFGWITYVALAAFVFGLIFWWTKKLVYEKRK